MRLFIILLLLILSSCSGKKAQIIKHQNNIYSDKNYYKKNRLQFDVISKKNLAKIAKSVDNKYSSKKRKIEDRGNETAIIINSGDTLYAISNTYNVPNRDLIEINNLTEPYILKEGQKLRLPSFKYHNVQEGENLYSISRIYDMKIGNLIALNDLKKPYNIKIGDKIRISETASINRSKQRKKSVTHKKLPIASSKKQSFIWPVQSGIIISKFGQKSGGLYNDGINIKPDISEDVFAIKDGKVAYVGNELRGYGNLVIIKHSNNWISAYAHLDNILIKKGQKIRQGTKIANMGVTGNVSEKQLYFSLRHKKEAVDPEKYLKK
ncbi:M23 family metallopeptidase [Rickettsiales bacterium]|nr:M23 family metallopeptidase [Rickettsiales bacterium]MDB2550839.1 M23 family metallopeptidase [Rickettsiales bacterium]